VTRLNRSCRESRREEEEKKTKRIKKEWRKIEEMRIREER